MLPSIAVAQAGLDNGGIGVQSARLRTTLTGWELIAQADIQLTPEIRQGLNSGVPLHFIVDIRIKRERPFWLDKTLLKHQYHYSLIYYELTRHYRLQSLTTGESANFRSLLAALDRLGRLQGLIVNRPDNFDNGGELQAHLSVRLDEKALPLPLQPLLSSTWKLASEDFAWSLN